MGAPPGVETEDTVEEKGLRGDAAPLKLGVPFMPMVEGASGPRKGFPKGLEAKAGVEGVDPVGPLGEKGVPAALDSAASPAVWAAKGARSCADGVVEGV